MMSKKLYVGNLSYKVREGELEQAFGAHGTVTSVKVITDFETGRSKGFGFLEMASEEEAQKCVENFDGKDLDGRNLRVSIAREKVENDRNDRSDRRAPRQNRW